MLDPTGYAARLSITPPAQLDFADLLDRSAAELAVDVVATARAPLWPPAAVHVDGVEVAVGNAAECAALADELRYSTDEAAQLRDAEPAPDLLALTVSQVDLDGDSGGAVASVHVEGRSWFWPDLHCQPYVFASINRRPWRGEVSWFLDLECELADEHRTQWNGASKHATREAAADEAAAFVLAAVPLLLASTAGVVVVTPGDRQQDAMEAAWRASPGYQPDVWGKANEPARTFERAWRAEHDWREFA